MIPKVGRNEVARGTILQRVRALAPEIRDKSAEIENTGRLTDGIIQSLRTAGVFGMVMPREMGGPELDPVAQFEVVESLATADGSVGWVAMVGSDGGYYAAHLPPQAAGEIYADRNAITASVLVPRGRARRVDSGYRVSGHWPFGSASLHAEWFVGGCIVVDDDGPVTGDTGQPLVRMTFLRAGDCRVHDNWQTTGLAGSGSNDWSVDDVFVPDDHTFSLFEPPRIASPVYAFPWFIVATAPAVSLGIARAAIDTLCALAAEKMVMPAGTRLQDDLLVQTAVGRAEAELGAARAYIIEATASLYERVCRGETPTMAERAAYRLAGIHAFRTGKTVVGRMYEAGGGSALYTKSPLDRHWRDVSTIAQHAFASERGWSEGGRALMGLDPRSLMLWRRGAAQHKHRGALMLSLQELSDRAEIQDVIIREAGAMDRRDWDAWQACFTVDAAIDYSENDGAVGNPATVRQWLSSVLGRLHAYQHLSSNAEIRLNGDRAEVRTMQYIAVKLDDPAADAGTRVVFSGIWFHDELVRSKAGWRIAKRHEELAWRHNFPADFTPPVAD